jgi:predicted aspartyl protease
MITGVVTNDRQAVIHLTVRGPAGQEQEIEAIIDTGFDGWLSLPSSLVAGLDLVWSRRGRALLGTAVRASLTFTKPQWIGMERHDGFPWTSPKPFR